MKTFYREQDIRERISGRKIVLIERTDNLYSLRLVLNDGDVYLDAAGDCCSVSWIEHLEMPDDVIGAIIMGLEVGEGIYSEETIPEDCGDDNECLKVYKTDIATDRGHITLEYRNASNGFYGSALEMRTDGWQPA